MTETGLTKNQILSELARSPHGKMDEYVPVGRKAVEQEPEFMAHLVAWNRKHGQIRDSKVALPMIALTVPGLDQEFVDNALAHIALLGPRELEKASRFALDLRDGFAKVVEKGVLMPDKAAKPKAGRKAKKAEVASAPVAGLGVGVVPMRRLRRLVTQYLREREADWTKWERVALQHRHTLANLYAMWHVRPGSDKMNDVLFKGGRPEGSLFDLVAKLSTMSPAEAAGTVIERKIPFLVMQGALGEKVKDTDLLLAMIDRMSPTELVTNAKMLERLGVKTNPALRAAMEKALEKASKSKANVLKTTRAADTFADDDVLGEKLRGMQERQLDSMSVEGNWGVFCDCSGSMHTAIEIARHVAGVLAKMAKGTVHLVFFDTSPTGYDVTGKTYDDIVRVTRHVKAGGSTSIGCPLKWMLEKKLEIDGVAIVSDGGENAPPYFAAVHKQYMEWSGKDVPVYLYHCDGDSNALASSMKASGIDMQTFEMGRSVDFYSLPNIVATMRTNRYSLVDEVMESKLLTLADVFKHAGQEDAAEAVVA